MSITDGEESLSMSDVTEKAFSVPLRSTDEPERLANYLFDCVLPRPPHTHFNNQDMHEFFANCIFMGQSVGGGKSRLAVSSKACNRGRILTLYINCGPADGDSFPSKTLIEEAFTRRVCEIRNVKTMRVLYACLYMKLRDVVTKPAHCSGCDGKPDCFYNDGGCYFEVQPEFLVKAVTLDALGVTKEFIENPESFYGDLLYQRNWLFELLFLQKLRFNDQPVILTVYHDDAGVLVENHFTDHLYEEVFKRKALMNTFRLIRRVLYLPVHFEGDVKSIWWWCPFIFVDTCSQLAKFCPLTQSHSSVRERKYAAAVISDAKSSSIDVSDEALLPESVDTVWSIRKVRLRDPFIVTGSWNLFAPDCTPNNLIPNWHSFVSSCSYLLDLAKIGRPMWGASIEALNLLNMVPDQENNNELVIDSALKYLQSVAESNMDSSAILPTNPWDTAAVATQRIRSIAVTTLLVGIEGVSMEQLRSDLIQRYMAFMIKFDSDSLETIISYPQEPILSILAGNILRSNPVTLLRYIMAENRNNSIDLGKRTLFYARVLILFSHLLIPRSENVSGIMWRRFFAPAQPIPVVQFLGSLIGRIGMDKVRATLRSAGSEKQNAKDARAVLEGQVVFSHWGAPLTLSDDPLENWEYAIRLNTGLIAGKRAPLSQFPQSLLMDERAGFVGGEERRHSIRIWRGQTCASVFYGDELSRLSAPGHARHIHGPECRPPKYGIFTLPILHHPLCAFAI